MRWRRRRCICSEGLGRNRVGQRAFGRRADGFRDSLEQLAGELPNCRVGVAGGVLVRRRSALRVVRGAPKGRADAVRRRWDALAGRAGSRAQWRRRLPQVDGRVDLWRHARGCVGDRGDPAIRRGGQEVMFYPFILMDQMRGQRPARSLERGGGSASTAVARADHARRWRRVGAARRTGRRRRRAEVAAFFGTAAAERFHRNRRQRSSIPGPPSGAIGGSSCITRIFARLRAGWTPSASDRKCVV